MRAWLPRREGHDAFGKPFAGPQDLRCNPFLGQPISSTADPEEVFNSQVIAHVALQLLRPVAETQKLAKHFSGTFLPLSCHFFALQFLWLQFSAPFLPLFCIATFWGCVATFVFAGHDLVVQ